MTPGVLTPPKLPDGFRSLVQPFTIRQQRDQFDGAEEFDVVGFGPPERPQLAGGHQDGDIVRRAVQQLGHPR